MKKLYSFRKLNFFSVIAFMVMMVGIQIGAFAQSATDCIAEAQPVRTYFFFVTTDNGVTYDTVSVKIIKNGEVVPRPEFVGIEYSTFKSWYTVSNSELFSDNTYKFDESNFTTPQTVTESDTVRLYASLTHDVFHVIFMDGVGDDARVFRVWERLAGTTDLDPDNEQVIVDATTKSVGWYYDQALTQQATTFTMPSYDVVLYPDIQTGHWVKYQSEGGTYVDPDFYQFDETTNKPDDPQRVGYSFSGWNNGTEPWYRADGTVNQFGGLLTDELTLTAVWAPSAVNYTVVYWVENADDENYSFNNVRTGTANSGTHITTLDNQYTTVNTTNIIDGLSQHVTTFSYDKNTQADATDVTVAGDGSTVINLYFKRKTYTLTFDPSRYYSNNSSSTSSNRASGQTTATVTAKYGANIWNSFPISRNIRAFLSMYTYSTSMWKATNTSVYSYPLQTISTMPGANVTFYLYYNGNENEHTIYYDLENIEGTGYNRKTVTTFFNFVTYTEEYCDIQGFSKQSESEAGFGTITLNSSTFDHAKKFGDDGTVTLEYYRNSYDIRFYNGGTELSSLALTRKYQQVIGTLPVLADSLAPVGKDGFSFGGWYENQLCEGDPIDITSTMPAAHVILYAKWNAPDYTVRIHHTVAAVGDYDDVVVAYGEQVPSASLENVHPCSDNAPAYGWSILNDDGTKSTFASDMQVYRDLALVPFCLLTGERYTITYNMNCEGAAAVVDASVYADGSNPMVMSPSQDTCGNSKNKFLGWKETGDIFHYPGNGIYMTENKTLTALWGSGTEHTEVVMVEHHPTTGDQTSSLDIVTNGTTPLNLPENFERPDRPNDLFIGWSLSENNTMPEFAPGESVVLSCDVSIYPVWMQVISNMPSQSVCEGLDVDLKSLITYHIQNDAYTYGTIENIQDTVWIVTKDGAEFTDYTDLVISSAEAGEYVVNMVLVTTKGVTDTLVNIINVVSGQFDPVFTDLLLTYCEGEHDALPTISSAVDASGSTPAIPAVTGVWQSTGTGTVDIVTAVPSEAGVYNLTFVPDAGQCANSVNVSFTVVEAPVVNINGENTFCAGGSTELQAVVDATVSVEEYQWMKDEVELSSAINQTYNVSAAGNYKVEIITTEGCVVTSDAFAVSEIAVPVITVATTNAQQTIHYGQSIETITLNCANGSLNAPTSTPDWITLQSNATGTETTINGTSTSTGTYSLLFTGTNACPVEAEQEVIITVNPDTVTVSIEGNTDIVTYDGNLHDVTGFTFTSDNPSYLETDFYYNGNVWVQGDTVGEYSMNLDPLSFENYNSNFYVIFNVVQDGKLTITAATMTVTVTGHTDSKVYNGSEQSVTGYDLSCTDALYDATLVSFSGDSIASGTEVNTYPMGLEPDQFSYNNSNINVDFEVTDGSLEITTLSVAVTVIGEQNTATYDGEWHSVETWSVTADNDLYDVEYDIAYYCNPYASRLAVGTTEMGIGPSCFENVNTNFNVSFTVEDGYQTIEPAEITINVTGNTSTEVYTNTEYVVSGYTLSCSDDLYDETYVRFTGTAEVSGTEVNTYPMGLAPDQFSYDDPNVNANFEVSDGWLEITAPDAVIVTIVGNNTTVDYDGEEHDASGYTVSISNPSYTEADFTFNGTDYVAATAAGTTFMGLEGQFENINPTFTNVSFRVTDGFVTINPINVTVTVIGEQNTTVYDGEWHSVESWSISADNDLYDLDFDISYYCNPYASQQTVGTTNMSLGETCFENNNNNFNVTFDVTDGYQEITPAEMTVTVTGATDTKVYTGDDFTVSGYTLSCDSALYDEALVTFTGDDFVMDSSIGTHLMGLSSDQFSYGDTNIVVTFDVTDGWLEITSPGAVVVTITGNNTTVDYDGTEHEASGYSVSISNPAYTEADFTFNGTDYVAATDAGTTYMGLEGQFENQNPAFTDVTFEVTDGYVTINPINVTVTVIGEQNTTVYDGEWHTVDSWSISADNDLYDLDFDISYYCNPYASQQTVGTTNMSLGETCFENNNNNFNVTFDVTDGYQEITPAEMTVTVTGATDTKVYTGDDFTVSGYTLSCDSALYDEALVTFTGDDFVMDSSIGTHLMGLSSDQFSYGDTNIVVTFDVTDGWLEITSPGAVVVTITGHCDTVSYDGMSHVVEGYDVVSIEIGGVPTTIYTEADFEYTVPTLIEETNVGSYNMGLDPANFNNLNTTFNVTFVVEKDGNLKINPNQDPITVTITGHNNTVGYNGSEHQVSGYDVTISGSTLYTEADFEFIGTENDSIAKGTNASSSVYEMNLSDSKFQNINTNFTNVEFVVANGFIRILPQNVTVTITCKETTKPYNGHIQSALDYEYTISPETTDFTFSMLQITSRDSASGVNVGTYDGVLLFDYLGSDENYEVMVVHQNICKLTITPVDLTITAVDQSYPFNGSVQGPGDVILSDPVDIAQYISIPGDGLKGGDYLNSIQVDGQSPSPAIGTYSNYLVPSHATFKTALFEENGEVHPIPENYNITYVNGAIIITDPSLMNLTITASSDNKVYDGTALTNNGYTNTELAAGDHIESVTVTGSQTVVGTSDNVPSAAVIKNAADEDVTSSYNITYVNGTLEVETREVTVSVADSTTEYNGSEQYGNTEYTFANVVSGQTATIDYTPSYGTLVNTYDNGVYDVSSFTVVDASDNDVTSNYTLVDWTAGKLTVTDRTTPYEVTMTSKSNSAPITYDGLEHSIDDFVTHTFTVDGNTYTVSGLTASSEPQIFAGTYNNVIEGTAIVTDEYGNNVTDQFTVNTVEGTLTISKRLITFTIENPEDATKVYDGTPLTITFDKLHVDNLAETDELIDGTLTSSSAEVGEYTIEDGNMFYMMATGTFTKSGFKIKHSLYPSMLAKTLASYSASISLSGSITSIECAGVTYQGHPYEAVQIGTQCWLAENLRNTATAAGPISYVAYNEDDANAAAFGYLYTWYTAVGVPEGDNTTAPTTATTTSGETYVQGICPDGWAIPSHTDMEILKNFASGEVRRLRDMSTSYWIGGAEGITPNYGFKSRGGGFYNSVSGQYERMLLEAYYWESNSVPGSTEVKTLVDAYYCSDMLFQTSKRTDKRSVRCIRKDNTSGSSASTFTCGTSKMKDANDNEYETMLIGTQCWTKTNLRATKDRNGNDFINGISAAAGSFDAYADAVIYIPTVEKWNVNNSSVTYNNNTFGYYYNWTAANNVCPVGWHLPSDAEWTTMEQTQTSMDVTGSGLRGDHAGKLAGEGWNPSTTAGAPGNASDPDHNASGFSAVPAGYYYGSSFYNAGFYAYFWSSTQHSSNFAWGRNLNGDTAYVIRNGLNKSNGYSVRCLRD